MIREKWEQCREWREVPCVSCKGVQGRKGAKGSPRSRLPYVLIAGRGHPPHKTSQIQNPRIKIHSKIFFFLNLKIAERNNKKLNMVEGNGSRFYRFPIFFF